MIFNGGKVYRGNVVFSKGKIVGVESTLQSISQSYDEVVTMTTEDVTSIIIYSDVDVKVNNDSPTNEIVVHLSGHAIVNGELKLSVVKKDSQIIISSKVKVLEDKYLNISRMPGKPTVISDYSLGDEKGIRLVVQIPKRPGLQWTCSVGEGAIVDE